MHGMLAAPIAVFFKLQFTLYELLVFAAGVVGVLASLALQAQGVFRIFRFSHMNSG